MERFGRTTDSTLFIASYMLLISSPILSSISIWGLSKRCEIESQRFTNRLARTHPSLIPTSS